MGRQWIKQAELQLAENIKISGEIIVKLENVNISGEIIVRLVENVNISGEISDQRNFLTEMT